MAEKKSDDSYRYALYYPSIHIRDETWLKTTLLAFRQVRRIVPFEFTVKDEAITRPYSELYGPDDQPLLQPVAIGAYQVRESLDWLRRKIQEHIDFLTAHYSWERTPPEWQDGPETLQIHVGKILNPELVELLKTKSLAWHSRDPSELDSINWLTLHPKLGSAIMSILALSIARLEGLCIVTASAKTHHELLANREDQVFEKLLDVPLAPGAAVDAGVTSEELAHVVITTGFDLTRLTPEQICELLKEGKDLRAFHSAVEGFASRIPPGLGPDERARRLKVEAQAVLDEWAKYTDSLPAFAAKAMGDFALDKLPDFIKDILGPTALAATVSMPTLIVTVAVAAGVKMFRKPETPLRFLSRVDKAVKRSVGSIYVPQWRRLAG